MLSEKKIPPKTCGWERYFHINYDPRDSKFYRKNLIPIGYRDSVSMPEYTTDIYDLSEYNGWLYYTYNSYLFSSTLTGAHEHVLLPLKKKYKDLIIEVNQYGIFVIYLYQRKIEVQVYTLDGDSKSNITIELDGRLENSECKRYYPYICDNRLFFIVRNRTITKAVVATLDIDNSSYSMQYIYEGAYNHNGRSAYTMICNPEIIIGCLDYAIVCVEYSYEHKHPFTSFSTLAWYYISFTDGKMYCLSNPKNPPEIVKQDGDNYCRYLDSPNSEIDWYKVAHFDIQNNIIWLYDYVRFSSGNRCKCLVPCDLRPDFYKHQRTDFSVWKLSPEIDEMKSNYPRYYFDGVRRFLAASYSGFSSFNKKGEEDSWSGCHGACDRFSVNGNLLFLDSDLSNDASIFDLNNYYNKKIDQRTVSVPQRLRTDWRKGSYAWKKQGNLIEEFENNSKKAKKAAKTTAATPAKSDSEINTHKSVEEVSKQIDDFDFSDILDELFVFPQSVDSEVPFVPENKLDYWEGFGNYLDGKLPPKVKIPKAADRSWFALRLGSSKVRIECSLNIKNQTLRVGFFMENSDSVYGKAYAHRAQIDSIIIGGSVVSSDIRWDNSVSDSNVSVFIPFDDMSRTKQYETMKDIICSMTKILEFIDF